MDFTKFTSIFCARGAGDYRRLAALLFDIRGRAMGHQRTRRARKLAGNLVGDAQCRTFRVAEVFADRRPSAWGPFPGLFQRADAAFEQGRRTIPLDVKAAANLAVRPVLLWCFLAIVSADAAQGCGTFSREERTNTNVPARKVDANVCQTASLSGWGDPVSVHNALSRFGAGTSSSL